MFPLWMEGFDFELIHAEMIIELANDVIKGR
jgi:hypothetical protein